MIHPLIYRASNAVVAAIKTGKLVRPKICPKCGYGPPDDYIAKNSWIHAHHEDYLRPLDITWLCPLCHKGRHLEIGKMTLPIYTHKKRRHLKFGEKTYTFSVKLPLGTIDKIRERQLDMGRTIYDMVEQDLNPYETTPLSKEDIVFTLVSKLVRLMVEQKIIAPEDFFTVTEQAALRKVAMEEE